MSESGFDPTPDERFVLAIFGVREGQTPEEALAELRAESVRAHEGIQESPRD